MSVSSCWCDSWLANYDAHISLTYNHLQSFQLFFFINFIFLNAERTCTWKQNQHLETNLWGHRSAKNPGHRLCRCTRQTRTRSLCRACRSSSSSPRLYGWPEKDQFHHVCVSPRGWCILSESQESFAPYPASYLYLSFVAGITTHRLDHGIWVGPNFIIIYL